MGNQRLAMVATFVFAALNIYAQGDVLFNNFTSDPIRNPGGRGVSGADGILVQL